MPPMVSRSRYLILGSLDKNWAKRAACEALDRILWGQTRSPRGDRQGPQFAMIRVGGPTGGTIGLLAHDSANPLGSISMTPEQRAGIHVELTTDVEFAEGCRGSGRKVNHAR